MTIVRLTLGPSSRWSSQGYGLTSSVGVGCCFWVDYAVHPDNQSSPHLVVYICESSVGAYVANIPKAYLAETGVMMKEVAEGRTTKHSTHLKKYPSSVSTV